MMLCPSLLFSSVLLLPNLSCSFSLLRKLPERRRCWRSPLSRLNAASNYKDGERLLRVVVVGGGVGGLAIASRIASSSIGPCLVTILEKNERVGGRCGSFDVTVSGAGTFRHERGPSLLLLPDVYTQVFSDAGVGTAEDFGLAMQQCAPAYKVIFEDGDTINLGLPRNAVLLDERLHSLEAESRRKMESYEPEGAAKWDEYMRACEAFLDCGLPNFIEERLDLRSFPAFLREALRDFGKAWPLKPHSDVLDAIFESDKMKALASFQDLYVGLEPYRNNALLGGGVLETTAPAVFGLLAAIELHPTNKQCGVFAPIGGFRAVSDSLERLARKLNVDIQCGKTVTSVTEDGVYFTDEQASAPTFEPADLVVVNADLPYATKSLINQLKVYSANYDWDDRYRFSNGVIAFHWSLSKSLDDLNTHNVFMSAGNRSVAEQSWQVLRDGRGSNKSVPFDSPDKPFNFYVHRASETDQSAAPKGMDSILVLVPCKTLQREESYSVLPRKEAIRRYTMQFDEAFISRARDAVLHRLAAVESLKDLRTQILHEVVDTPATYADQCNVGAGTPFALSHGFAQLSLTRPGPASSGLSNVLFCGASTRPGNGVPLVLIGAKLVAEQAVSEIKSRVLDPR